MVYFQQSLFGKMSWERFHQMTGWILEPSYPLSQTPMFQCLLLEDGQEPEWCEGEHLTSLGGSWTPSIALLTEHKVKLLCLRERVSSDISGVSPFST